MTWQQMILTAIMFRNIVGQQCGIDTYSIYQRMLKDHTFKTFHARPGSFDCRHACNADVRCQSYNYVMFKDICELNNRTKEARPEDFVKDEERYYMEKGLKRVPLGSIPELPADSCKEVKASERGLAVSGNYWLDSTRSGNSLLAQCDMQTETVLPPAFGCVNLTRKEASNSYEVNAVHNKPPRFCLVLPEEEINVGDPYTITVELMNVIGWLGLNSGHPGIVFNVFDENNFDFVYFRPHKQDLCYQLGYVTKGQDFNRARGSCPNGSPSGGVWLSVRVEVSSNKSVKIYLNNDLVTSLTAHFDTKGRGGVSVQND